MTDRFLLFAGKTISLLSAAVLFGVGIGQIMSLNVDHGALDLLGSVAGVLVFAALLRIKLE